jgi:hypothetical protein
MSLSRKFVLLFVVSLIGFTLGYRFSQLTVTAKPLVIQPLQLAAVQYKAAPFLRQAEGNTS